jgi:nucleotide-binding universal stress UspA family protein
MSYRDFVGFVLAAEADEAVLAATGVLADQANGRATAVLFEPEPEPPYYADAALVSHVWSEVVVDAHKQFLEEEKRLRVRLEKEPRPWILRSVAVLAPALPNRAALEARHADLTVIARPDDAERRAMFEAVLFGSGRPLLMVPPKWRPAPIGRHVAIGWNAKREASRALADARPLMEKADKVTIITVDARPGASGHGEAPGADIAAHLARCGLNVEVVNADSLGRSDGQTLIEEARAREADVLAIGGYGHARLQQMMFGGATREIVTKAPLPVLMSH